MSTVSYQIHRALQHPLTMPFYVPSLLFGICMGLLKPILPLYAADFNVTYAIIGIVLAADALGTVLGDLPAGVLLRRWRDKQVMLLGLGMIAGSMVMLFLARSIPVAILFLFTFGVGHALYNVSTHMYIMSIVTFSNRGRAISLLGGIHRVGNMVGPIVGGMVATALGLRVPFLLIVGLGVLAMVVIAVWLRSDNRDTSVLPSHQLSIVSTLKSNSRTLMIAGAGQLFAQMIRTGRNVVIPLYGADVLGLDAQAIGLILGLSSALDMMLFYPAGWIMDNLGRKFAIVPSFIIQAAGMALVVFSPDFTGLLAAASLIGLGNGIGSGTMMTLGSDLAPPGSRGEFLGMWRLIGDVGATSAPLVVGWIAGLVVLPAAAGAVSVVGVIAALIFAFLVPETLKQKSKKR